MLAAAFSQFVDPNPARGCEEDGDRHVIDELSQKTNEPLTRVNDCRVQRLARLFKAPHPAKRMDR